MLIPFIRTLILYLLIILAIRLMGKRQVGEMQPTELVITILVSAVASVPMQDIDIPITHGIIPVLTLISAEVLISAVSLKCLPFRKILTGKPVPIISDGIIDQKALKKLRLNIDDIFEDLRLNGVYDIRQVKYAQVETNGQLSVLQNSLDVPVTPRMMSLSPTPQEPFLIVISDGKLIKENLRSIEKSEKWLSSVISAGGAASIRDVFLLCADKNGNTIFSKKVI